MYLSSTTPKKQKNWVIGQLHPKLTSSNSGAAGQNPEPAGAQNSTSGGQESKSTKPLMRPFL